MAVDVMRAEHAVREFLTALGVETDAAGMEKTPARVAEMYAYLFDGLGRDAAEAFGEPIEAGSSGLVAVQGIPFFSMCEHHLVPFFGTVDIVYQPNGGRIAGFTHFVEAVAIAAHRPQLQERLTHDIADAVQRGLGATGVLAVCHARQLCMTLREGGTYGTETTTSETIGVFANNFLLSQQAWALLKPPSQRGEGPQGQGECRR